MGQEADSVEFCNQFARQDDDGRVKPLVAKRSIVIGGHKTSVSLEDEFWKELRAIARERGVTLSHLVQVIDNERKYGNLSSAIRVFIFEHCRSQRQRIDSVVAAPVDRPAVPNFR